jgi:hypothetical protein
VSREPYSTTSSARHRRHIAAERPGSGEVNHQLDENSDKVLVNGRIDAQGMYAFKTPALEYNVVIEANKGHVASMSSEDIW